MSIDSALASVAMLGRGPILGSYGAPPDRPPPTPPNQNRNRSLPNTSVVRHSSDPDVLEINEALKQVQAQQSLLQHRALGRQKSSSVPNSPRGSTGSLTPPELPSKPPTSAKPSWKASNKTNGRYECTVETCNNTNLLHRDTKNRYPITTGCLCEFKGLI